MTTTVLEPIAAPSVREDAPEVLDFVVKQEHIDKGCRRDSTACAVLLALEDAGYSVRFVSPRSVWLDGDAWTSYDTPRELKEWIRAFDRGSPVFPERFKLTRRTAA